MEGWIYAPERDVVLYFWIAKLFDVKSDHGLIAVNSERFDLHVI